jgi:hypothetical protein
MVSVVVPLALADAGLNVAVAPDGSPPVPNVTVELYPPAIFKVTV